MIPLILLEAVGAVHTRCRATPPLATTLTPDTLALLGVDAGSAKGDEKR